MSTPPTSSPDGSGNNSSPDASPPPPTQDNSTSPSPPSNDNSTSPSPPTSPSPTPPSNNNNNNNSAPPGDNNGNNGGNNGNNGGGNNNNGKGGNNNNNNNNKAPSAPAAPKTGGSAQNGHTPSLATPSNARHNSPPNHGQPQLKASSNSDSGWTDQKIFITAGIAGGIVLILIVMIVICCVCSKRKKRKAEELKYYRDNSSRQNMNNTYYNNGPKWQSNGPPTDHMVKISPGGPVSAGMSSEQGWPMQPPPPPLMISSSELSSAGFSGPHQPALPPPHPAMALGFNQSSFSYDDLAAATGGFAQSNLLGQGGFGYVHKGVLPNGKEIAVKSLKSNSGQGEREFQAEVDIISRVHHRHLVSLVGYCIAGAKRLLVYEFVPNSTLEFHLHGSGRPVMDWPTRLRIALGSAKGFAYLHEDCHPRIIHRDIKAANILLDLNFEAKVADFGLAKLSEDNHTHVSTRIMGTFGYLAPEYASSGKLTEKSDVYSFGIMLLELITGRRPIDISSDDDSLVDWARPILIRYMEGESYEELVDPRLENNYDPQEMVRMVASAAACIRHSARRRPKMSQIVRALEGAVSLDDLNQGVAGAKSAMLSSGDSDFDVKHIEKHDLHTSQEFSGSEDGHTSEFHPQASRGRRNYNL